MTMRGIRIALWALVGIVGVFVATITLGVVWTDPSTILAPLTGVLKNSTVAVCGAVVWALADPALENRSLALS